MMMEHAGWEYQRIALGILAERQESSLTSPTFGERAELSLMSS